MTKVSFGEAGVLAAEFDLSGEGEVIANQDMSPGDHGGRKSLVVAITQSDDPAVVDVRVSRELDLEESKVTGTVVTQGVGLPSEDESSMDKLFFNFGKEVFVRHGIPGFSVRWG